MSDNFLGTTLLISLPIWFFALICVYMDYLRPVHYIFDQIYNMSKRLLMLFIGFWVGYTTFLAINEFI